LSTESAILFGDGEGPHPYAMRRSGKRVIMDLDLDGMEYAVPARCECGQRLRPDEAICFDCMAEAIREGRKIRQVEECQA